jgi:hypothetical protein
MDDIDTDAPPPPPPADDDSGEAEEAEGTSRSGETESSAAAAGAGSGAASNDTNPVNNNSPASQTGGQAGGQTGGSLLPGSVGAEVGVGGIEINANVELPPVLSGNGALNLDLNLND